MADNNPLSMLSRFQRVNNEAALNEKHPQDKNLSEDPSPSSKQEEVKGKIKKMLLENNYILII